MPIVVDSAERCGRISEVASDIVARAGLHALTIRAIASAAGSSTSFVTDYFADKRSVMQRVLTDSAMRMRERILAVRAADPGDLYGCAEAYLPVDDDRRRDWRIYLCFWEMAATDPAIAATQRRWQDVARDSFVAVLAHDGVAATRRDHDAQKLLALVMGLSTIAVFDPETWTPARLRTFLRTELATMGQEGVRG